LIPDEDATLELEGIDDDNNISDMQVSKVSKDFQDDITEHQGSFEDESDEELPALITERPNDTGIQVLRSQQGAFKFIRNASNQTPKSIVGETLMQLNKPQEQAPTVIKLDKSSPKK
jgi:hypothetical protein